MSVQTEIDRIQKARNDLRTKGVALGIAVTTDNLTELATKYNGIADKGTPNAEVKEGESYTIAAGYYHGGVVKGVKGGGNYSLEKKTVTPSKAEQSVEADSGYYGLSTVVVNAIPDAFQDVTSVTATADKVLAGSVFVDSAGKATTGTMSNRGAVTQTLDTETKSYTIPQGYHSGTGTVSISTATKTVTPTKEEQSVVPSEGKVLSSVTVERIPESYGDVSDLDYTAPEKILVGNTVITMGYNSIEDLLPVAIEVTGTMPNNGSVGPEALAAGESYTVPRGYHTGSGKVTTKTLAEQTFVDSTAAAAADQILTGYQAWVNGEKVTGAMAFQGASDTTLDTETTYYTIPKGYHTGIGKVMIETEEKSITPSEIAYEITPSEGMVLSSVTVEAIPAKYGDATNKTATAANVLSGKTAVGWDSTNKKAVAIIGTMTNNGAVTPSALAAGGSYTIPAGYHNGSGKVTTKTLAAQTGVDSGKTAIAAAQVLTGYQGWVNGTKITGTMANNGAVAGTITGLGSVTGDTYYTIPAGYHNGSGKVSLTSDIETALAAI